MGEQSRRSKVEKELSVVGIVKKRKGGGCERGEASTKGIYLHSIFSCFIFYLLLMINDFNFVKI